MSTKKPTCFVLMPISDPPGYSEGHFRRVYEDILKPACEMAGFDASRGDEVKQANLIHLDILQKIIDSPIALCDLSGQNPNALFELGLRQAFDKPVVLVQEVGSVPIFDIAPLRYVEYRPDFDFRKVLEDQTKIAAALTATYEASLVSGGVNSIVRLLALTHPAALPEIKGSDKEPELLRVILAELSNVKSELRELRQSSDRAPGAESGGINNSSNVDSNLRSLNKEIQAIGLAMERINTGGLSGLHVRQWIDELRSRLRALADSEEAQTEVTPLKLQLLEENIQRIERLYAKVLRDEDEPQSL